MMVKTCKQTMNIEQEHVMHAYMMKSIAKLSKKNQIDFFYFFETIPSIFSFL